MISTRAEHAVLQYTTTTLTKDFVTFQSASKALRPECLASTKI